MFDIESHKIEFSFHQIDAYSIIHVLSHLDMTRPFVWGSRVVADPDLKSGPMFMDYVTDYVSQHLLCSIILHSFVDNLCVFHTDQPIVNSDDSKISIVNDTCQIKGSEVDRPCLLINNNSECLSYFSFIKNSQNIVKGADL